MESAAAGRLPMALEKYLGPITSAVLENYAKFIVANSCSSDALQTENADESQANKLPRTIEEALSPLEILYGKTALSAIGIALHGAEPIIRYVERSEVETPENDNATTVSKDGESETLQATQHGQSPVMDAASSTESSPNIPEERHHRSGAALSSQAMRHRERHLYQVGEHTLFSPFYCPCSAYVYQSIQKQNVWCCKHLLALQLVLRVEAHGVVQDNLRVRIVSPAEYEQLLLRTL